LSSNQRNTNKTPLAFTETLLLLPDCLLLEARSDAVRHQLTGKDLQNFFWFDEIDAREARSNRFDTNLAAPYLCRVKLCTR
jgi:hypothetical protein